MSAGNMRNIIRIIILVTIAVAMIWFFTSITWVLGIFTVSLFIVYALVPIVDYFKFKLKIPHGFSVGLTFILFVSLFVTLLLIIIPIAIQEIQNIVNDLPRYFSDIQNLVKQLEQQLDTFDVDMDYFYAETMPGFLQDLQPALESIAYFSLDVVSGLINFLLVILIVFFMLYDFHKIRGNIISLCPEKHRQQVRDIIQIIDINFGGYIRGTIIRLFVVGGLVGGAMFVIGMPYAFLLGLFAGIMDIFPYIGPYIAAVPAIFISLSPYTPSILLVVIIYGIVQILESFVLSPLLLGKAVKIKPITVIVCMLTGQQIAGILGMVLFVPLAGIIKSLVLYYQEKQGASDLIV